MFSKACEYAIRATIIIASESTKGNRLSLKEVSEKVDSPEAFTAKILQKLVKSQIIQSVKGPGGGFEIDIKCLHSVKLVDVVLSIEGGSAFNSCGLGLKECSELYPCPFHNKFKPIREKLKRQLESTSIAELIIGFQEGHTFLKTL